MFGCSSVRSPWPLWHRKRSPRGVAFGCSTRCAKSTNFGCECGSIGNWRRERKQHIFVNAVNAKVGWMIDWMKDWIFMDNFPYEWTWHHILCEICEWARRHVAMCCVRSYHYISIARVGKNATAFIEAFLLSWQAGCLEVEQSSGSSKWFLLWWETDLDMNFQQNSERRKKTLNFQHKFPTQISKPFSSALHIFQADWKPFATLGTAPGSSRKSTFTGMAWLQPTNGQSWAPKFLKNDKLEPQKKWRWMVQTKISFAIYFHVDFSGGTCPRFLGFMSKIFHGVYMPKGFTSQQMGHRTWLIPRCLACQVYRRGSRSDVSPPFRFWGRDEKSHRFGGFSGIIWNYQMFEGFRDFP